MLEKYKNNYLRIIKQYVNGNLYLEKHKVFEILSAIDLDMILWEDLPPDFDTKFNVPHKIDYGVDLVTLEYDKSCQVKLYNENSRITWSDISKYYTYSKGILNIDNMILATTKEAKLDKMGEKLIEDNNIEVIRKDFDKLIQTYSPEINRIDFSTTNMINPSLEERHYLLECYKIFNESTDSKLYFQLPCGTGKSYIMLYILSKYIQDNTTSKHIIFCPWIDLAKQMFELFIKNNIKTDFIGDGKHTITESSNVIICINMSVSHIPGNLNITYKIIDEAHHLESEDSEIRKQIDILPCEKELNLSATFHNQDILDFNYPMNEAITDGYISDYQMVIGYFETGDKTDELVSLIKNHPEWSPIFVYFNSTEKSKNFNNKLKEINIHSTYLTGKTSSIDRENTKKKIENGELQVVCLCGVYNEGVSIDCLQTVIFGDLRHSQINKIQIAMRANRKHSCKPFYRVVLPVVESDFSEKDIQELIRTFAEIDPRLVEDIRNKNERRIKIIMNNDSNEKEVNLEKANLLYEQVYNRFGELVEGMSPEEIWYMKFEELKGFIDKNKRRPRDKINNIKEKQCGQWLSYQIRNYKIRKSHMNNENICNTWIEFINDPKYNIYFNFKSDEEKWYEKLEEVKKYININKKKPNKDIGIILKGGKKHRRELSAEEDIERKLGNWVYTQKQTYKNKRGIMGNNKEICNSWNGFVNDPIYSNYFKSDDDKFNDNFKQLKIFIDTNNRLPNADIGRIKTDGKRTTIKLDATKNMEKQLGRFFGHNNENYKYKKGVMKTDKAKCELWKDFVENEKYCKYFKTNEELWYIKYNELKDIVDNNKKISGDILINWHRTQNQNYNKKQNIMGNNTEICKCWKEFIESDNYINYFKTNDMMWDENFNKLKEFIDINKKLPSHEKNHSNPKNDSKLGAWVNTQRGNYNNNKYNMKSNETICNKWKNFVENEMYSNYFKTPEDIWYNNFNRIKEFIDDNKKLPNQREIYSQHNNADLRRWIYGQKKNYTQKKKIMRNKSICSTWSEFINDPKYIDYFKTDVEIWYDNLNKLKQYININHKLPVQKRVNNASLSNWVACQRQNYIKKKLIMKNHDEIHKSWKDFIEDNKYSSYFKTNEELWFEKLDILKEYIDTYNKRPRCSSKNLKQPEKIIGKWLSHQITNYNKKTESMKDPKIYNAWAQFITDYNI